jgi:hypothetical protein
MMSSILFVHCISCSECLGTVTLSRCSAGQETRKQLTRQLAEWHRLVGPAAAGMVFVP